MLPPGSGVGWISGPVAGAVCKHGTEPIEAIAPRDLELVEQVVHVVHTPELTPHELLAAAPVLGHESGIGENSHVLLHCREAHGVETSKIRHGPLSPERFGDDVSPSRVREGVEDPIGTPGVLDGELIYNHSVVGYATSAAERKRCSSVGDISVTMSSSALLRRAKSSR